MQENVGQERYPLSNILPLTLCCAQIRAITTCNGNGSYFIGNPVGICEQTQNTPPSVVTNLMAPDIDHTSFGLTWDPPLNFNTTPGVMYDICVDGQKFTVTDATYFYVSNLEPCTTYSVQVSAYIPGVGSPSSLRINVTTRTPFPPPPQDVTMSVQTDHDSTPTMLMLMWNEPSQSDCNNYNIQTYKIYLRCSDYENETVVNSSLLSVNLQLSDTVLTLGWCVSSIQSCRADMMCGNFSNQAQVTLPPQPPPQPICFIFLSELSSEVTISYAITQPFQTDDFMVNWMLNSTGQLPRRDSFTYNTSVNVFNITTDINTEYDFELEVCNAYGCGPSCNLQFTTNVS